MTLLSKKTIIIFIVLIMAGLSAALLWPKKSTDSHSETLNVFTWSGYVPQEVVKEFEADYKQKYGKNIVVNVSEYNSNETMHSKLEALRGSPTYDIVFPSSYYVAQMISEANNERRTAEKNHQQPPENGYGLLDRLDLTKLPNVEEYAKPYLMHQEFDPNNNYSVPYLWGVTGIAVNKKYFPNYKTEITGWNSFWEHPKLLHNKLLMLDEPRDVFTMAFMAMNRKDMLNAKDPALDDPQRAQKLQAIDDQYKLAYEHLKKLMPEIRVFNSDAVINMYADRDLTIGMGWVGDVYKAQTQNPDLEFVYPKDSYAVWVDCASIVNGAPHKEAAYAFINFLYKPDIAKQISEHRGYASALKNGSFTLDPKMAENPLININSREILNPAQHPAFQDYLGPEVNKIYQKYWSELKLGAADS